MHVIAIPIALYVESTVSGLISRRCSILNPRESQRRLTLDTMTLTSDFGYETNVSSVCIYQANLRVMLDYSIRIPAMKYTVYPLSFLREKWLVFIRWGESLFSSTIRWRNSCLKYFPSACTTTDQSALINAMRKLTSFCVFPSAIPDFRSFTLISLILWMILRKHIHGFRKFVV